jgi:hypothetical protein
MWSKRVRSATVGPGVEVGALIACLGQTQTRLGGERERDWGHQIGAPRRIRARTCTDERVLHGYHWGDWRGRESG